jgi:hypothetical protein
MRGGCLLELADKDLCAFAEVKLGLSHVFSGRLLARV